MSNAKIDELKRKKAQMRLTYEAIAQKSGLPISTVQKVLGGKVASPRIETLEALDKALSKIAAPIQSDKPEISIGNQDFAAIIENGYFYIDKTSFIKKWWESADVVTLITRPRRFGKTLNMSMLDYFFSNRHENSSDLFANLSIWDDSSFRKLQGYSS